MDEQSAVEKKCPNCGARLETQERTVTYQAGRTYTVTVTVCTRSGQVPNKCHLPSGRRMRFP